MHALILVVATFRQHSLKTLNHWKQHYPKSWTHYDNEHLKASFLTWPSMPTWQYPPAYAFAQKHRTSQPLFWRCLIYGPPC